MPPLTTLAPYSTANGEVLWAVVPPRNESGTSSVDILRIGDALVAAVEEVRGVRAVPINRTIEAMRALKMEYLSSPADARKLAAAMQTDGIVVGSVTAYNPYTPEIGITVALFSRPGALQSLQTTGVSAQDIATLRTDQISRSNENPDRPLSLVSAHFDARNNQVLADLETYAEGRMNQRSALGWKSYAASVDRFTEFVAYRTINELIQKEWMRVGLGEGTVSAKPDNSSGKDASANQVHGGQVDTPRTQNAKSPRISASRAE